jgi:hypothetical protein
MFVFVTACGGSLAGNQTSDLRVDLRQAVEAGEVFHGFAIPFDKLAADTSDDFVSQLDGSEFASDLPNSRCTPAAKVALLEPHWNAGKPEGADVAYCLYRLKMYAPEGKATLRLDWYFDPPTAGTCWIGIPDWSSQSWVWQLLPDTNEIALGDPAAYSDVEQHSYVAVVVLDNRASALEAIGYGAEPPPPPQYNLFAPMQQKTTYLVDMEGNVVHTWESEYYPAASVYLLENGQLLRGSILPSRKIYFAGGGGLLEEFDWDGERVWGYELSTSTSLIHHDFEPLPNGNILVVAWVKMTAQEMIDLGRNPDSMSFGSLYVDNVLEIEPQSGGGGQIVWEWRLIDHLVQDFDSGKPNYDPVSSHPELVDVNYSGGGTDWTHINSIDYNAALDQIVLSVHGFDELWIIDHGTTTAEAATHEGGPRGRGGDLLYRWGNPKTYIRTATSQQKCYGQHDVQWIPAGYPGEGHLLLFNNRLSAPPDPEWPYSTVLELVPPLNIEGRYDLEGYSFGPEDPVWEFRHDPPTEMFSATMSGCQRLPNGNTLACCAESGWILEATSAGEVVWDYATGVNVFRATRLSWDYPGLATLVVPPE